MKKALAEVIARKRSIGQMLADQQKQLEQQITVIDQEQNRIRQNMAQLDRNTDLYNRYVKKFGEQEDQVESLRQQIAKLTADETKLRHFPGRILARLEPWISREMYYLSNHFLIARTVVARPARAMERGQRDVLGADGDAVLGVAADLDAAFVHQGVEPLAGVVSGRWDAC